MKKVKTKYGLKPIIRIKEILEQKNLTQKELAELMGETPQQINKWVMGVEPCLSALGRIAMTLGITLDNLVWYKGDDANFDASGVIYIRGEIFDTIKSLEELLDTLKQYYRWTDEERCGINVLKYNIEKSEIVLGCINDETSAAFIDWAKKDRDYMYRM